MADESSRAAPRARADIEVVVFVLLCATYVLGEAARIAAHGELRLTLTDVLLLFSVLVASLLIYRAFTWGR